MSLLYSARSRSSTTSTHLGAATGLRASLPSCAHEGDNEQAASLLVLALHHPATEQLEKDLAQSLLDKLEPAVVAKAQGKHLRLEEAVERILQGT